LVEQGDGAKGEQEGVTVWQGEQQAVGHKAGQIEEKVDCMCVSTGSARS
jgi:hypothetical protein